MAQEKLIETLQQKLNEQLEMNAESHRIIDSLNKTINELNQTINGLNQTIKELTEKSNMNSRNSSKPPSSDGLNKPSPKSLRKPSGKKAGGQAGHPGTNLIIMSEPIETVQHISSFCRVCPRYETCKSQAYIGETRQIIDAVVNVKVSAHQSIVIDCPINGMKQKGEFPDNIKATIQYGENLQALVVALNTIGAVSVNRTHEIISGIFNIPLSTGTISNMVDRCADSLKGTVEIIRQKVTASKINNFDETGTRVDGKTIWVHNASNSKYTHLTINANRGQDGMDAGKILPKYKGIAVHDCWSPYWKYPRIQHALCNVHLLRELINIEENYPEQCWATDFKNYLLEMKKAKEQAVEEGKGRLGRKILEDFSERYDKLITLAYAKNPFPEIENKDKKRGRKKNGKILSLIQRLDKHKASVCLFIHNFAVPFDNNQAERDQRMIKTKTKVSGCFRSLIGAENYLKIMSYVGTVKKHGYSAYEAIRQAISGNSNFFLVKES